MVWARVAFGLVKRSDSAAAPEPKSKRTERVASKRASLRRASEPAPVVVVPDELAKLDRAAREKRLADAEAKLDAVLPLFEKFELEESSPESEEDVARQARETRRGYGSSTLMSLLATGVTSAGT